MNLLKDDLKTLYSKYLIPSLGSAMVMSIYTLTDAIVIGKGVGADALAAVSITTPLLCILMATGILLGVGGAVSVSVHRGTGNEKVANQYFTLSLFMISAITLILWFVYGFSMPSLLKFMGANETLFPYAMSYMHYMNLFLPVVVFSNYIAILIRADHDPNRAMVGVLVGGLVNIVLDIVLVFPCKFGIGGAALASTIGMVVQVVIGTTHFFSKDNKLCIQMPDNIWLSIKHILGNGIPSFFNEFANGFIVLLFNIQILRYGGSSALAVYSVIANCVILFNSLFTGVGQSIQPIISTNFGAEKFERIRTIRKMAFITVIVMGTLFSLSGIVFPNGICNIFMPTSSKIQNIAKIGIRLYFITFFPHGINLLTSYYFQAILGAKQSLCISILRNIVLSCTCILVFPLYFGATSLWIVMPVVEVTVMIISFIFLILDKTS